MNNRISSNIYNFTIKRKNKYKLNSSYRLNYKFIIMNDFFDIQHNFNDFIIL